MPRVFHDVIQKQQNDRNNTNHVKKEKRTLNETVNYFIFTKLELGLKRKTTCSNMRLRGLSFSSEWGSKIYWGS